VAAPAIGVRWPVALSKLNHSSVLRGRLGEIVLHGEIFEHELAARTWK